MILLNHTELEYENLLKRIEELKVLNRELLNEKEQQTKLEYAWTGNLGHWYWNFKSNTVTFNPLKVTTLGYSKEEIPEQVTYQYFTDKLHPEDYPLTMKAMKDHLTGKANVYEVEYRIKAKDGSYRWYHDLGKITQYDDNGAPILVAGIVFDITQKKELQYELECKNKILHELSELDGLTKLYNHRMIMEHLQNAIDQAEIKQKIFSIIILDIDDFKKVNDTKGHLFGDQVIMGIATIIKNNIRKTDIAGRYGGEEFLIILTDTDISNAINLAEKIRKSVEEFRINGVRVTISGGIQQYDGSNKDDLISNADKKLYDAKRSGKNKIL